MPIYEYECRACGHHLELLQNMKDEPLKLCPNCQQEELAKLVSAAGFQLKGTGWYKTDYKKSTRENKTEDKSTATSPTRNTDTAKSTDKNTSQSSSTETKKNDAKSSGDST